jgi:uncharacterized coiled-coil protein SlyX
MSESTQEGNDNIKTSDLATTDDTLIQTNLNAEATELQSNQGESRLPQDEIQMTLKEFNQKIKKNDRSIKRIEESITALYEKLDKTPQAEQPKISSKKKLKKERKLGKKGKKERKLGKKGKKKGKKIRRSEKTKSAKAVTSTKKRRPRGQIQGV